jgi:hypothetical protein
MASKFNGTWTATLNSTDENEFSDSHIVTLIIKDSKEATSIEDETRTLPSTGGYWRDTPRAYRSVPSLYSRNIRRSTSLVFEGSRVVITWSLPKLVDWLQKQFHPNTLSKKTKRSLVSSRWRRAIGSCAGI